MRDSSLGRPSTDLRRYGASALVEREGLLHALQASFARARGGRRATVLVTGAAGLGKTSLIERFLLELLDAPDVWIARGECVEHYGAGEAYLPVLDALGRLGRLMGGPLISTLERYAPLWLAQLPALIDVDAQAALQARLQHAAPARMLRELAEALEVLSADRTLVFSFEDLHWCDASTCALLMYLARRRDPAKLLILGTLRADEAPDYVKSLVRELLAHGWVSELSVPPLTENGVRDYLRARLSPGLPEDGLVQRLHQRTRGNALFLAQSVDALFAEGALERKGTHWALKQAASDRVDPLPKTLEGLAHKRVEGLSAELRALIEVASVAGHEFAASEVASALGWDLDSVELSCLELARDTGLLENLGMTEWPDGTISASYRFSHALLHQAIYEGIEEARRARLHRQIGERLERAWRERSGDIAPILRRHFEAGRNYARALVHVEEAARLAMARNAIHETIEHLRAALSILPAVGGAPEHELVLREKLGSALTVGRGWTAPDVLENYTRALALCEQTDNGRALAPVLRGLSAYHQMQGELGISRAYADRLVEVSVRDSNAARVQAHTGQIGLLIAQGEYLRGLQHAHEAVRHYRHADRSEHAHRFGGLDPAVSALSWASIALWSLGFPAASEHMADLTLQVSNHVEHPFSAAFARYMVAIVFERLGRVQDARRLMQAAAVMAERESYPFLNTLARAAWVAAQLEAANRETGLLQMRQLVEAHAQSGVRFALPDLLAVLAGVELRTGELDAAAATLERALQVSEQTGQRALLPALYLHEAELALARGGADTSRADALLAEARAVARAQHAFAWELRAAIKHAEWWLRQGRSEAARELLRGVYTSFDEGFDTADLARAGALLRELGEAPPAPAGPSRRGPVAELWQGLRAAAEALCQTGPFESSQLPQVAAPRAATTTPPADAWAPSPVLPPAQAEVPGEASAMRRLVLEGEYWTISYAGRVCRIKDGRGMGYLARLVRQPHREVHVLDLSADVSLEDASPEEVQRLSRALGRMAGGDAVDARARAAYQARVRELLAEVDEARAHGDLGRLEALERERELLEQELSRAFGLGGRPRNAGAPAERARINVTRAIKSALRRIAEHHPELGHHLTSTIRTGTFCVYAPDPTRSHAWHVEAKLGAA